ADSRGAPAAPPPARGGSQIVASSDDFRPEAVGIFRVPAGNPPPALSQTAETAAIPLPPHRPPPAPATPPFNDPERCRRPARPTKVLGRVRPQQPMLYCQPCHVLVIRTPPAGAGSHRRG